MTVWLLSADSAIKDVVENGTKATLVLVLPTGHSLVGAALSNAQPRPQLLFADLSTVPDALRALQFIKSSQHFGSFPVVAITEFGAHARDTDATSFGCHGILRKPFSAHDVAELIIPLLQRKRW